MAWAVCTIGCDSKEGGRLIAGRIEWNKNGFRDILGSPEVLAELGKHAARTASAAGDGYEVRGPERSRKSGRGRAAVITGTDKARRAEAKRHNLGGKFG